MIGRLRRRSGREGANLLATSLLLLAALIGINWIANRRNLSWDTTTGGRHSLAPQTVQVLAGLDREVRLVVLDQPRAAARTVELFERYADESDRIAWEVIDPEAEPARARAFEGATEAGIPFGTVVVVAGERQERLAVAQEQDLTNALVRLLRGKTKQVRFVTGHRERSLDETGAGGLSAIRSRLEESNYEVSGLSLLEAAAGDGIPEDAAAVVVAGPRLDLIEAEARTLAEFVRAGGSALVLLDPEGDLPTLTGLVEEFGIVPAGDVVMDGSGVGQLFGFGLEAPLAAAYGFHPATRGFENSATVFPLAQSLIGAEEPPEGVRLTELVLTSASSWGERSAEELASGRVQPGDEDRPGPLTLAWAAEVEPSGSEPGEPDPETAEEPESRAGRLVIVGDADFIGNNLALAPLGNADLFLNIVNWLTEDEDLIAIRPRAAEDRRITMTTGQLRNTVLFCLVFLPGFFLIWGVAVWWSRR